MPISAIYNVKGGTLAQYDEVIEALGENANAPGALAHIATATTEGFLVCDIWESQEAYDDFAPNLAPKAEAAGIGNQAAPLMGRVENMLIGERAGEMPAVAILYSFPGMQAELYYDILRRVHFEGLPRAARRAHIASETAEGMFVLAIWGSEAAFREFEPALRVAFASAGVETADPEIGQIHRMGFNPGAVRKAHV